MPCIMSVDDMEQRAIEEEDNCYYVEIREEWLMVHYWPNARGSKFVYRWGKNKVTRDVAITILASR